MDLKHLRMSNALVSMVDSEFVIVAADAEWDVSMETDFLLMVLMVLDLSPWKRQDLTVWMLGRSVFFFYY